MQTLSRSSTRLESGFALRWALATAVGWLVGFVICEAFKAFFRSLSSDGAVIGTCVGIAQWLVLGERIDRTRWWILASIIGFAVGKAVGDALAVSIAGVVGIGLSGAAIGASLGLTQWVVLRRHVARAGWWVPASALAWVVGWIIGAGGEGAGEASGGPAAMAYLIGLVGAAVAGGISGASLIWLYRARPA